MLLQLPSRWFRSFDIFMHCDRDSFISLCLLWFFIYLCLGLLPTFTNNRWLLRLWALSVLLSAFVPPFYGP